jgi:UDP-glucose 4-epimerase
MLILLGGAGFIGRHLQTLLQHQNVPYAVVTRRLTAVQPGVDEARRPPPAVMSADQFAGPAGDQLIAQASGIINMISLSVPGTFAHEPWREVPENVAPAAALFARCATLNPHAKLVHLSSGGTVYGRIPTDRASEDTPAEPISGYGMGKLMIEEALRFTGRTTGMPYAILRVSNPVGPFQTKLTQGIVPIAVRAAWLGQPFRLFGDGSHVRDYMDADDLAEAILVAWRDQQFLDRIWNVGSGMGRSILEVLGLVERVTGLALRIERSPGRAVDVARIVLDCGRIERELGWTARRGLDGAVAKILVSLREKERTSFL